MELIELEQPQPRRVGCEGGEDEPPPSVAFRGGVEHVVAGGRVDAYLDTIGIRHKLDPQYRAGYIDMEYVPNLTLDVLENAGVMRLLERLHIPRAMHCPHRLYAFMRGIRERDDEPLPPPPATQRTPAIADGSMYEQIDRIASMCRAAEQWFAGAAAWLQQARAVKARTQVQTVADLADNDSDCAVDSDGEEFGIYSNGTSAV